MRFEFTEEQDMLRDTIRALFRDRCPPDIVRASWENDDGQVPGLWPALAEMGVLGLLAPESAGGLGMTEVDLVRLLEEAGYAGVPEPLVEHVAVAVPALAESGSGLLEAAIDGSSTITIALDDAPVVAAARADAIIVRSGSELTLAREWSSSIRSALDQSRRLASISDVVAEPMPDADAGLAFDRAVLGTAAQAIGVAQRLLDATVDYVGQRHQFGKPVGSYQAVKHHLADVAIAVEFARPLVYRAAWSVARPATHDPVTRGRDVSMAKSQASDAVDRAARAALQCHGAIGYTFEYDLQLWLKRGWALAAAHGDARRHRDRVAAALVLR